MRGPRREDVWSKGSIKGREGGLSVVGTAEQRPERPGRVTCTDLGKARVLIKLISILKMKS